MILKRLYELADREGLLQDPAFDTAPVAAVIQIDDQGNFCGIIEQRTRREDPPKKKGGKAKITIDKGKLMSVPVRPIVLEIPKPTKAKKEPSPRAIIADSLEDHRTQPHQDRRSPPSFWPTRLLACCRSKV